MRALTIFSALAILLWGLWGFLGKLALQRQMPPITIFFWEVVASLACSLVVFAIVFPGQGFLVLYGSWNIFGLLSGTVLAVGLLFYYLALNEGPATIVAPLTATYPVISALLSYLVLGEKPRWTQWVGIFLVVLGVVLLLGTPVAKASNK
jgi:transporter family protein